MYKYVWLFFVENKLRWVASDLFGTAFTKNIDLQNATHLQIKQSGNYFIYSSTTFDHSKDIYVETFYQSLTKFHPLLPRTGDVDLVFSKFGGSKTSDKHHTNFLAGVFELQRGYLISSSLSQSAHNFLDQSNQVNNYIGLFKLWDMEDTVFDTHSLEFHIFEISKRCLNIFVVSMSVHFFITQ